jgi:hypothetical protein
MLLVVVSMTKKWKRVPYKRYLRTKNNEWAVFSTRPWIQVGDTVVWLICIAVSKSKRQLNDWLNQRKNKRVHSLSSNMTGKSGPQPLFWAFKQMHIVQDALPVMDSLWFWFDAVEKDKQRRVYMKWFERYAKPGWQYLKDSDSFYFFKSPTLK